MRHARKSEWPWGHHGFSSLTYVISVMLVGEKNFRELCRMEMPHTEPELFAATRVKSIKAGATRLMQDDDTVIRVRIKVEQLLYSVVETVHSTKSELKCQRCAYNDPTSADKYAHNCVGCKLVPSRPHFVMAYEGEAVPVNWWEVAADPLGQRR